MKDFSNDIAKILDDYSDEVVKVVQQAEQAAGRATVRELKAIAPRDTGHTGYDRSFTTQKEGSGRDTAVIVYSKKPGLTHLLENGHAIVNQYGTYGRYNGKKHWAPAERVGIERFEKEIRDELGE